MINFCSNLHQLNDMPNSNMNWPQDALFPYLLLHYNSFIIRKNMQTLDILSSYCLHNIWTFPFLKNAFFLILIIILFLSERTYFHGSSAKKTFLFQKWEVCLCLYTFFVLKIFLKINQSAWNSKMLLSHTDLL